MDPYVGQWHRSRMAAAQNVFRVHSHSRPAKAVTNNAPLSIDADEIKLDRFWRRVAELTSRYYDADNRWIGGQEIKQWNSANRNACERCMRSRRGRTCIIDEDQASCRACRSIKVGCDRKARFVYDMTKEDFFPVYAQFMSVFHKKEAGRLKRDDPVDVAQYAQEQRLRAENMSRFMTTAIEPILNRLHQSKRQKSASHQAKRCTSPTAGDIEAYLYQIREFQRLTTAAGAHM
ncbi:hypothetical protein C8R43DRAFT_949358 [Mycena crocata]|nr:hypothetical protein C8R43DRAFT_949358 [Mycena crocata]